MAGRMQKQSASHICLFNLPAKTDSYANGCRSKNTRRELAKMKMEAYRAWYCIAQEIKHTIKRYQQA